MPFRCINAFQYGEALYAGGQLVDDGDPILDTHSAHFARVAIPVAPGIETASTDLPKPVATAPVGADANPTPTTDTGTSSNAPADPTAAEAGKAAEEAAASAAKPADGAKAATPKSPRTPRSGGKSGA
ncbi:hypothetical protein [Gordonia sp. OPL2]|uniref:hypothetical protein n=1 Tax=Gordonia sp. OPL2 TaxID=2486274 RepID=UPI001655E492|nr:hypothetical protein [Gordonia sp. OPL2]